MKRKIWLTIGLVIVVAAMTTLTRCGSGVGQTAVAEVGAMKF